MNCDFAEAAGFRFTNEALDTEQNFFGVGLVAKFGRTGSGLGVCRPRLPDFFPISRRLGNFGDKSRERLRKEIPFWYQKEKED